MLSVGWEARIRCIGVWHRIPTDQRYLQHLIQRFAYLAFMHGTEKKPVDRELRPVVGMTAAVPLWQGFQGGN